MALVVEDGTGLSAAESYLSVADADAYHTKMGNSSWTGTDAVKEVALRKATQYLDSTYVWVGTIASTAQALNWPREGAVDSQGRDLDNIVPSKLEDATAELALASLSAELVPITDNSNFVTRQKVGEIEIEYKDGAPTGREYNLVNYLLTSLFTYKNSSSNTKLIRA